MADEKIDAVEEETLGEAEKAEAPEALAAPKAPDAPDAPDAPEAADDLTHKAFHVLVHQDGKFARGVRWYGRWLTFAGWFNLIFLTILVVALGAAFFVDSGSFMAEFGNGSLATILSVVSVVLSLVAGVIMINTGRSLRKSRARKAAEWSRVLMWAQGLDLALSYMLSGPSFTTVITLIEIIVLIVFSVALDPTLAQERREERDAERAADKDAAAKGMLGRDLTGKGYMRVNFFNLFWMFFVCSILGLILEIIWHMVVVDPGNYEERAGLLFGPFSPIYGFGAVLVTLALNRLYDKNPAITFVVAGLVGGAFEWAVSFFMETSFGIKAWDYSDYNFFGIPDPVAVFCGGRTSTQFLVMWGILGLVWVKVFLPVMIKVINSMPWQLRYNLTTVMATLMLVNCLMTLGSLDCWYARASGLTPSTPIEQFFGDFFPDSFMKDRFQSMKMNVNDSTRVDTAHKVGSQ